MKSYRAGEVALKSLVVAVGLGVAVLSHAAYYEELTTTHLPPQLSGACMNAAAGDVDGDGDIDLALAMEFQPKVLLLNDGAGHFADASAQLPQAVHDSEDVAFADFDNDGDLDLVFVSEDDRTDELYLNDGSGRYTDASVRLLTNDVSNDLVLVDLDGDGNLDLLTGNVGLERALISDGKGGFRDETGLRWPQLDDQSRTQELEVADVDGDGDLDVIVANEGQDQLYVNEEGRLVDVTVLAMPVDASETRAIRAADVDADDDLDLLVGNVAFLTEESPQDYLLLNDGVGNFTRADASTFPEGARSNFMLQTLDIDRDGDMDAIAPSTVFADGSSRFSFMVRNPAGAHVVLTGDMFLDDFDGDGDPDAQISDGTRRVTLVNDGTELRYPADEAPWTAVAEARDLDVNGNGELDLRLTTLDSSLLRPGAADAPQSVMLQVIDLNRDGRADILSQVGMDMASVGNYQVLLNDGAGQFSVAAPGSVLPVEADGNGFDVEVADFDGDGLDDLFFCNRTSITQAADQARAGGLQRLLRGIAE